MVDVGYSDTGTGRSKLWREAGGQERGIRAGPETWWLLRGCRVGVGGRERAKSGLMHFQVLPMVFGVSEPAKMGKKGRATVAMPRHHLALLTIPV